MSTETYAVSIQPDHKSSTEVPLHISFWCNITAPEITYVKLITVAGTRERVIASIPVSHPAGVVLNLDNWAGYLYQELFGRDKMKKTYASAEVRGCYSVKSYPSFGYYYFEIDSLNGLFAIIVDRPSGQRRPMRPIKQATVIKHPFADDKHFNRRSVFYNDEGLFFQRDWVVNTPKQDPNESLYFTSFRERLTKPQIVSIYTDGFETLTLNSSLFHKATDDWELRFCSIEGFDYFKSLDRKIIFTLQSDPIQKAFGALYSKIHSPNRVRGSEDDVKLLSKYRELSDRYALFGNDEEVKSSILSEIIDTLEWSLTKV